MEHISTIDDICKVESVILSYLITSNRENFILLTNTKNVANMITLLSKVLNTYVSSNQIDDLYSKICPTLPVNDYSNKINTISEFYVIIAHIYGVIMIALNPDFADDNNIPRENILHSKVRTSMEYFTTHAPELKNLYYDKYNLTLNKFDEMTDENKKQYDNDLRVFYTYYTGCGELPESIKYFSDINLEKCFNASVKSICHKNNRNKYLGGFAQNIREIIEKSKNNKNFLIKSIKDLFTFNSNTMNINSNINTRTLSLFIDNFRHVFIKNYLTYEQIYKEYLAQFKGLYEFLKFNNCKQQLRFLDESINFNLINN